MQHGCDKKAKIYLKTIVMKILQILVPRFNSGRGLQNFPQYSQLDRVAASTMLATVFHHAAMNGYRRDVFADGGRQRVSRRVERAIPTFRETGKNAFQMRRGGALAMHSG
jgi:hypothetical protein